MKSESTTEALRAKTKTTTAVTHRPKQAKQKRVEAPASMHFINILERISDGIVAFDVQMNYTFVNKRGGELLGRKPADLIGKNYWEEYPEAKGTPFANAYVRALETQNPIVIEDYYAPFDRWFENRIYPSEEGLAIFFTEITEHKKAQLEIERLKQFNESIIQSANDGIIVVDENGILSMVNRAGAEIYGRQIEEIVGHYWKEIIPEDQHGIVDAANQDRQRGKSTRYEMELARPNGERRHVLVSGSPRFEDGKPAGTMAIFTDITERKRAEESLRHSEERFYKAFHTSPAGMTITRIADGKFVDANDSFCRMFEISREEVIGHTSTELNMWTLEERKKLIDEQIRSGGLENFELQARSKSGRIVNILFSSKPMELEGEPHHVTTMIDITEWKGAEEQIRFQANLLVNVSDAVLATDTNRIITYWNHAAEEKYGWTSAEALGKPVQEIVRSDFTETQRAEAAKALSETGLFNAQVQQYHRDGRSFWVEGNTIVLRDTAGNPTGFISINRDITERKRAEEELRKNWELFERTFHTSPISTVLTILPDRIVLDVNENFEQAFGYRKNQIVGKPVTDFDLWDDSLEREKVAEILVKESRIQDYEFKYKTKSGKVGYGLFYSEVFGQHENKYVLTKVVDITERRRAEEELRERVAQLAALNALGRQVIQIVSLEETCGAAIKGMLEAAQPDAAYLFLREGEKLLLKGIGPEEAERRLGAIPEHRVGECMCGLAVREGRAIFSRDIFTDLRCTWEECKKAGFRSFAALPLRSGTEIVGVLGLAADAERDFEIQAEFLETLATQISVALQNARLLEETRLSRDGLAELSRRLVDTHEKESRAIGRELHDQIGQMLTATKLTLEIAAQLPAEQAMKKISQTRELVDDLMKRVSRLSLELRPPMLDDLGLIPALLWHVNRYQEQSNIPVDFKHSGAEGVRFDTEIETTAYRIVQEALTNVARHARARRARLEVRVEADVMKIKIEDDGAGFDPKAALERHRGLSGMRERVNLLGGTFQIESQIGRGTKQFIELPLKERA